MHVHCTCVASKGVWCKGVWQAYRASKGVWHHKQRDVTGQAKGCGRTSKGVWQGKKRGVAGQAKGGQGERGVAGGVAGKGKCVAGGACGGARKGVWWGCN